MAPKKRDKSGATQTVIGLLNEKGGVGKTTLALVLAGELASRGRSVVLVDADTNKPDACRWRDLAAVRGQAVPFQIQHLAREHLTELRFNEEFVIFDLPGKRDQISKTVAAVCDLMLLPTGILWSEVQSVQLAKELMGFANQARITAGRKPAIIVAVLNRLAKNEESLEEPLRLALEEMEIEVLGRMRQLKTFRSELNAGRLLTGSRASEARKDVSVLVDSMLKRLKG